ncbi:hypothetical protein [Chlorobium phaeovibrioides]|uniref:hypothetical protein n=1 Tax=Chlorobium phaeovibrioides TaxID=1094 RepID=UPI00163A478D|nr:hypothetical protein [Chlorobium phaeovibrioides]
MTLRIYVFFFLNVSDFMAFSDSDGGDSVSYHIPRAQLIETVSDAFNHLFMFGGDYNGRLTHVLLAVYSNVLEYFGFEKWEYVNLYNAAYLFNSFICIATLLIYYKAAINFTSSKKSATRAIWFLAFNPYFFSITTLPHGVIFG